MDGQPNLQASSSTLHRNPHSSAKQVNPLTTCAKSACLETVVENSRPFPFPPLHSLASSRRATVCLLAALENMMSFLSFCFFLNSNAPPLAPQFLYTNSDDRKGGAPRGKDSSAVGSQSPLERQIVWMTQSQIPTRGRLRWDRTRRLFPLGPNADWYFPRQGRKLPQKQWFDTTFEERFVLRKACEIGEADKGSTPLDRSRFALASVGAGSIYLSAPLLMHATTSSPSTLTIHRYTHNALPFFEA